MALPHHLFLHRNARAEVALDAPWPGTPVSGDPHTVTLNGYESEDGKRLMGIWESSPGVWKVDYKDWEYCHFLEAAASSRRKAANRLSSRPAMCS